MWIINGWIQTCAVLCIHKQVPALNETCIKRKNEQASENTSTKYYSGDPIKEHVARMGEMRNAYNVLVGKPKGNRPLERPRRRWQDNIRMDVREIEWESVDWIYLAQDRDRCWTVLNTVMKFWVA
jgi:hypothetical protein